MVVSISPVRDEFVQGSRFDDSTRKDMGTYAMGLRRNTFAAVYTLTNFAPFLDDNYAHLFTTFLLKLLEPNCGAETCGASADDANIDVIRDALNRVEVYILVSSTSR